MRAFTLIELLVVVAIIAILAAIALPNFLEAQTQAKVSRARADMRTIATALESYRVDWPEYPPSRGGDRETDPVHALNGYGDRCTWGFRTISLRLSTPVAYLTWASPPDPFKRGISDATGDPYDSGNPVDLALCYHNIWEFAFVDMLPDFYADDVYLDYGHWRLFSIGPDGRYNVFGASDFNWYYDPTNGTRSSGFIVRTQLDAEGDRLIVPGF
jgi:general secretion pathway protein G